MSAIQFTEDESDLVKEVFNISMGQAGKALATLLNSFVELTVPNIRLVAAEDIVATVLDSSVFSEDESIVSFQQSFSNEFLDGTTIIVFDDKTKSSISTILGMPEKMESVQEMEFMLELSNILVGACMNSISRQLFTRDMSFANPELIAEGVNLREMAYSTFMRSKLKWGYTLLVTISLYIKDKFFKCDLIVFMSEKDTEVIRTSIQEMMPED
ncbi:hypothetical protein DSLASN_32280 [Desulfoluna limicola]|uniref:Chemotaxis protein CheC n=1 Tax=Desulfoluna limicola TaxID=2810562 RepID=A0ABM7PJV2_9BACT|nr:hypothetical protein [Desulfoluna limicola]BCS97596.1 hypothetical protein DSLASN_32280 [Desulfoluna limicola]